MTLTDNGECTQQFVFAVTFRRYGIIPQIRFDADDIVCTLVAYNLVVEISTILMFSGITMCVVTSRLMYIFSLADRCTAMPVIRHIIRKILVFILSNLYSL